MSKLLALISNPDNIHKLRGDREIKEIVNCLAVNAPLSFSYEVINQIRVDELASAISKFEPDLIHFTGHGSENHELYFENLKGEKTSINDKTIDVIFKSVGRKTACVLFSACYSLKQAKIVSKYIPYTIGFPGQIEEELASLFSRTFYENLSNNIGIEDSFDLSKSIIYGLIGDKKNLPALFKHTKAKNPVFFMPPKLLAKFASNKKIITPNKNGNYDLLISVDPVPQGVTAITYEILEEDFPESEKCIQVTNLDSGCFAKIASYGNLLFHVWLWSETKNKGVGFKSTLFTAFEEYYGQNPPPGVLTAFRKMIKNDHDNG